MVRKSFRSSDPNATSLGVQLHVVKCNFQSLLQGLTVDKALVNITEKGFAKGLSYVTFSSLKSLNSITFDKSFNCERFDSRISHTLLM